jgi:hypothetical protein
LNTLLGIFVTLGAIAFAAAYPFLIRTPRVREVLRTALPDRFRPRDPGGFAAVSPEEQRRFHAEDLRRRVIIEAVGLATVAGATIYLLGDTNGAVGYLPVPLAALIGISGGIILRKLWQLQEQLTEIGHCASRMRLGGIEGSWRGSAEDPLPFSRELLRAVQESTSLDVLAPSGLSTLAVLSHPARPALEAPHPALAGKRLRLLVLPPRSQKVDPTKQLRSCAEEALSRSGSTPEKHWRRLQRALEIQRRWNAEYGCNLQVRFLEQRPIHSLLLAGPRGWFRPWFGSGEHWYEVASRGGGTDLRTSLDDHFESAWQDASEELSVFMRKDGSAAVMSTGSTAVLKASHS